MLEVQSTEDLAKYLLLKVFVLIYHKRIYAIGYNIFSKRKTLYHTAQNLAQTNFVGVAKHVRWTLLKRLTTWWPEIFYPVHAARHMPQT